MKGLAILLIIVMFWTVGLLAFAERVTDSTPAAEPPASDAAVALTGNASVRITTAVRLLEQGKVKRVLVSGVNPEATRADILGVSRATKRLYNCCVQLGFRAVDTKGNAAETAAWVKDQHIKSLIVVTADYHMPRALLEMRSALRGVALTPYPVATEYLDAADWWRTSTGAKRMMIEYAKYLAVFAREAFLSLGPREDHATLKPAPAT